MNLSDVIREISELGVRSQRVDSDYKGFINRAQRQLCELHNFTWMHEIPSVTVAAGETSADLPAEWKELDTQFSPVSYLTASESTSNRIPVKVIGRAEIERMGSFPAFPYAPYGAPAQYVFIEQNGGAAYTVNFPTPNPNSGSVTLYLSAFMYPAELVKGNDTNAILSGGEITEALINKAKAIAYAAENETDPRVAAATALAEDHFRKARSADIRRRLAGRRLGM